MEPQRISEHRDRPVKTFKKINLRLKMGKCLSLTKLTLNVGILCSLMANNCNLAPVNKNVGNQNQTPKNNAAASGGSGAPG